MSDDALHEEFETLRRLRDELELKVHLGRADLRDELDHLNARWEHLHGVMHQLRVGSERPLGELRDGARGLLDEVRGAYHRLRDLG